MIHLVMAVSCGYQLLTERLQSEGPLLEGSSTYMAGIDCTSSLIAGAVNRVGNTGGCVRGARWRRCAGDCW